MEVIICPCVNSSVYGILLDVYITYMFSTCFSCPQAYWLLVGEVALWAQKMGRRRWFKLGDFTENNSQPKRIFHACPIRYQLWTQPELDLPWILTLWAGTCVTYDCTWKQSLPGDWIPFGPWCSEVLAMRNGNHTVSSHGYWHCGLTTQWCEIHMVSKLCRLSSGHLVLWSNYDNILLVTVIFFFTL